jgi:hypothetical protein
LLLLLLLLQVDWLLLLEDDVHCLLKALHYRLRGWRL